MNADLREQLRLAILRHLAGNPTRFGLGTPLLLQILKAEGLRCEAADLEAEIQYLQDKGLVAEITKTLSPENRAFRITATGRDVWAQTHGN